MTIDEAIKHLEHGTEQLEMEIKSGLWIKGSESELRCKEGIVLNKQHIEWLTELKEAKRLLKMAVEDLSKMPCNNDTHSPDSCYICDKHGNCSYADSFKWCKADIALKLIGDGNNET
jgi:hypothetical protein